MGRTTVIFQPLCFYWIFKLLPVFCFYFYLFFSNLAFLVEYWSAIKLPLTQKWKSFYCKFLDLEPRNGQLGPASLFFLFYKYFLISSHPFGNIFFLSKLYTQNGAWTQDLKVKSPTLSWLRQPDTPPTPVLLLWFVIPLACVLCILKD